MSYGVSWNTEAADAIDEAWFTSSAADQKKLLSAVEVVNDRLRTMPAQVGESRSSGLQRVLVNLPVVVFYRVEDRFRLVRVFAAYVSRRKP